MRRTLVLALAALTVVLAAATAAAVTVVLTRPPDQASVSQVHARMHAQVPQAGRWRLGMGAWAHGVVVDSEFAYLAEMVAHHREAVAAAGELRRSDRPQLRAFGESIVRTQSAQIEQMQRWLATWYPGRSTRVHYRPMMRDLSGLSGDRLDRAFLRDMVGHHMAAVMMSQRLLARDLARHPQVEALAVSIRDHQHAEILTMARWLHRWFGEDWTMAGPMMRQWRGLGPR